MIGGLFTETVEVKRWNHDGTYVNGYFVDDPADPETLSIDASVQPTNGEDLEQVPEGERSSTTLKLYTETPLKTATHPSTTSPVEGVTRADHVLYNGEEFKVLKIWRYARVRPHYKVLLRKIYNPEDEP